jgi:seryl-tRNA synthetase
MEVSSERVYQVVMKQGHTIDFADKQVREFVFMLLMAQDKRLGRSEILNMAVPTKEDIQVIMDEYESDEARIKELEQEAQNLQSNLDEVVLRDVYGLEDEEVAVVDDFLEVW